MKVATSDGVKETRAIRRNGFLAITKDEDFKKTYTITHIPTGYAVIRGLSLKDAIAATAELSLLDWDFNTPDDPKRVAMIPDVRAIYRRYK